MHNHDRCKSVTLIDVKISFSSAPLRVIPEVVRISPSFRVILGHFGYFRVPKGSKIRKNFVPSLLTLKRSEGGGWILFFFSFSLLFRISSLHFQGFPDFFRISHDFFKVHFLQQISGFKGILLAISIFRRSARFSTNFWWIFFLLVF